MRINRRSFLNFENWLTNKKVMAKRVTKTDVNFDHFRLLRQRAKHFLGNGPKKLWKTIIIMVIHTIYIFIINTPFILIPFSKLSFLHKLMYYMNNTQYMSGDMDVNTLLFNGYIIISLSYYLIICYYCIYYYNVIIL